MLKRGVLHLTKPKKEMMMRGHGRLKKDIPIYVIDVETWGKQAENCAKYLEKGKRVLIEGKIKMNSWEKDGKKCRI